MAGGLLQVAMYGSQDIYLTGTPQITFFKIIYRRHTNFAINSIAQDFLGDVNFGNENISIIEKLGDLMHRVYLQITIPIVNLVKNTSKWQNSLQNSEFDYRFIQNFYDVFNDYLHTNTDIARKIYLLCKSNNVTLHNIYGNILSNDIVDQLNLKYNNLQNIIKNDYYIKNVLKIIKLDDFSLRQINIVHIFACIVNNKSRVLNDNEKKQKIVNTIDTILYPQMQYFYTNATKLLQTRSDIYKSFINSSYVERYNFAWIEELGHSIIDYIEFSIGNNKIDKHTGDFLIIHNRLYGNPHHQKNYNTMIGNIPILTSFNNEIKPSLQLTIPLQFWFSKHNGLALPLISLQYHDVIFTLKIKQLLQLCYTNYDIDIYNLQSIYNINIIEAKLWVDYVYLDDDERKRFAQSTHEYLIEVTQYNEFNNLNGKSYNAHLQFSNPTKYITWFLQPEYKRFNTDGSIKCEFNNFAVNDSGIGQTVDNQFIKLNTYEITDPAHDPIYFDSVQPYLYFNRCCGDGLYVYSFALYPMEHQPSSTCNLSRINSTSLFVNFSNKLIQQANNDPNLNGIYMGVYSVSYNILRFISGMAGLAFITK